MIYFKYIIISIIYRLHQYTIYIISVAIMESDLPKKKIIIKKILIDSKVKPNKTKNTKAMKSIKSKATKNISVTIDKVDKVKKIITKKNEFPKEGQIKTTPPESDSLRKFYTSLLRQKKNSDMAMKWCIEHGLFPGQLDNIYMSIQKLKI